MFRGVSNLSLDSKGRFLLPSRQKLNLKQTTLIITIDLEQKCLLAYPLKEWEILEDKLSSLPNFDYRIRRIQRLLVGHAIEVELDKAGRVLLPAILRDYAQLDKNIVLVGQLNKLEIWSEEIWNKNCKQWLADTKKDNKNDDLKDLFI